MSRPPPAPRARVHFCYACPSGFSGQREATELVLAGLRRRGWTCRALPLPVLERRGPRAPALLRYGWELAFAWLRCLPLLFRAGDWFCLNAGQTPSSLLRDTIPLWLARLGLGRERVVVSLHGSLFQSWPAGSPRSRRLQRLLAAAGRVTVLGPGQRDHLVAWGLAPHEIEIVANSCGVPPLTAPELRAKWANRDSGQPLRLLHLSSLIATKGYVVFLEALERLAAEPGRPIEAVVCGRMVDAAQAGPFPDAAAASEWIEATLVRINRSGRVRARWIPGAIGAEKIALFRAAEVFVFPSVYAVEAQPIVLLEAMASGCALLTTAVGEIRTLLGADEAIFLAEAEVGSVAVAIQNAAANDDVLGAAARRAHARFAREFSLERHLDGWEARLGGDRPAAATPAWSRG